MGANHASAAAGIRHCSVPRFRAGATPGSAQAWPTKPIKVVVPLTAGSATDVMARIVFDEVSQQVGQTDRDREPARRRQLDRHERGRQGRSRRLHHPRQFLDAHRVARGARHHAARHRQRSLRDHPARQHAGGDPVQPEEGLQAAHRLRDWAKANPGKANYSSAGAGNSSHLNGELFKLAGGFEAVHLPFKGAPEAMTEVIAGRSDFYFSPLVNALPLMKDGQLQALAVSNSSRASALPDLPTVAQAGYPQVGIQFLGRRVPAGEDAGADQGKALRRDQEGAARRRRCATS